MEDIRRNRNPMVDLPKFTFIKKYIYMYIYIYIKYSCRLSLQLSLLPNFIQNLLMMGQKNLWWSQIFLNVEKS